MPLRRLPPLIRSCPRSAFQFIARPLGRRSPLALFTLVFAVALSVYTWTAHLRPAMHNRAGVRAAHELAELLLPANHTSSPRLLILQHTHRPHGGIETASAITHAAYAAAHGYTHEMDSRSYVDPSAPTAARMMNKAHSMARVLQAELEKADGVNWILWSDADTVIVDPAVPAHLFLPPHPAMFSAAQDHNGMNAGVMMLRVHATTVRAVSQVIALYDAHAAPGRRCDQTLWGVMLRTNAELAACFHEMPKSWLNAYWLDEVGAGPVLQIHHVNWLKSVPFAPAIQHAVSVAREAREKAGEGGGNGLERMPQRKETEDAAKEWWGKTEGGIANMRFLDEEMGIFDAAGVLVEPFESR